MNSHARKRMPMLAALWLLALLALLAPSRPAATALPLAVSETGAMAAPDMQAADAQAEARSLADQAAYDDTPVLPAPPWRSARVAPIWPAPAPRRGAGTHPQPRLRPPSA
ncbi:hypothetical protein [Xanthomonas bundabergensis]|uniref:hypothetical protein n=1 Tax=Xanthomonas bundabergensis TaxID=3160842 RepID=UPI003512DA62